MQMCCERRTNEIHYADILLFSHLVRLLPMEPVPASFACSSVADRSMLLVVNLRRNEHPSHFQFVVLCLRSILYFIWRVRESWQETFGSHYVLGTLYISKCRYKCQKASKTGFL